MKKITVIVTLSLFGLIILFGCATSSTKKKSADKGIISTAILTIVGGAAGAAVDTRNPWRGAAIGASAGALIGISLEKLQNKAVMDAASSGKSVTYKDNQGNLVQAIPGDWDRFTKCKKVRRRTYVGGNMRSPEDDTIVEICEGQSVTKTY